MYQAIKSDAVKNEQFEGILTLAALIIANLALNEAN